MLIFAADTPAAYGVAIALAASLTGAIAAMSGGVAARRIGGPSSVALQSITLPLVAIGLLCTFESVTARDIGLGLCAGAVSGIGLVFFYRSFRVAPAGLVTATNAVSATLTPALFAIARGDSFSVWIYVAIGLAIPAVVLMSPRPPTQAHHHHVRPVQLVPALISGVFTGAGGIFLSYIAKEDPFAGSFGIRLALLVGFTIPWIIRGGAKRVDRRSVLLGTLASFCYIFVDISVVLASHIVSVAIVMTLIALYPVWSGLFGKFYLHEHLTRRQIFGMGISVVTVVLVALGTQ